MRRSIYIKDLFNARTALSKFDEIEVDKWSTFVKLIKDNLINFHEDKIYRIPFENLGELEQFAQVLKETHIGDKVHLQIQLSPALLREFVAAEMCGTSLKYYDIYMIEIDFSLNDISKIHNSFIMWSQHNRIINVISVDAQYYRHQLNKIVTIYLNTDVRFFDIKFDFMSFNDKPISILPDFQFHLTHLTDWMAAIRSEVRGLPKLEIVNKFLLTVFVDKDFKLYVNKDAYIEYTPFFDLLSHLNDNGETIPQKDLEFFHRYADLTVKFLIPSIANPMFIDLYQNNKMTENYNELPEIVSFVHKYLLVG